MLSSSSEVGRQIGSAAAMEDVWNVWGVVPVAEAWRATGRKPIGGRWVCCNKGDREGPAIRARWCAKEVATYTSDAFFAATPPLEAMRLMLSEAASRGRKGPELKVQLLDAKKAQLHAPARFAAIWCAPHDSGDGAPWFEMGSFAHGTQ